MTAPTYTTTSNKARNTANGSLVPDSTSSVLRTRGRRRSPPALIKRKTAAASVEATTAPISKDSTQPISRAYLTTGAVRTVVTRTPTVANITDGATTLRILAKRVRRPPSNRISARAMDPTA